MLIEDNHVISKKLTQGIERTSLSLLTRLKRLTLENSYIKNIHCLDSQR
ncbi:IS1 family transposase [Endozoicomonas sp. GU-1]